MQKLVMSSCILLFVTFGWSLRSTGEQVPVPQGELRIVDKYHQNWAWIVLNIFEHLIEIDKHGHLVPGLATSWHWLDDRTLEVKLRQGVKFHNGEVFDAEIVKLNWEENLRLRQPFASGEFMTYKPGSLWRSSIPRRSSSSFPSRTAGH
jgi:ABC-type transport system substrate-binding protein